jgi:hypothetical protein
VVYTVGFSAGSAIDAGGIQLLKDCASPDPEKPGSKLAFIATNASEVVEVFQEIARKINQPRISQ